MTSRVATVTGIVASSNTLTVSSVTVGSGEGLVVYAYIMNGSSGPGGPFQAAWNGGTAQAADFTQLSSDTSWLIAVFVFPTPSAGTGNVVITSASSDAANNHIAAHVYTVSGHDTTTMIRTSTQHSTGGAGGGGSTNLDDTTGANSAVNDLVIWGAAVRSASDASFSFNGSPLYSNALSSGFWGAGSNVFWGASATKAGAASTITIGATGDCFGYATMIVSIKDGGAAPADPVYNAQFDDAETYRFEDEAAFEFVSDPGVVARDNAPPMAPAPELPDAFEWEEPPLDEALYLVAWPQAPPDAPVVADIIAGLWPHEVEAADPEDFGFEFEPLPSADEIVGGLWPHEIDAEPEDFGFEFEPLLVDPVADDIVPGYFPHEAEAEEEDHWFAAVQSEDIPDAADESITVLLADPVEFDDEDAGFAWAPLPEAPVEEQPAPANLPDAPEIEDEDHGFALAPLADDEQPPLAVCCADDLPEDLDEPFGFEAGPLLPPDEIFWFVEPDAPEPEPEDFGLELAPLAPDLDEAFFFVEPDQPEPEEEPYGFTAAPQQDSIAICPAVVCTFTWSANCTTPEGANNTGGWRRVPRGSRFLDSESRREREERIARERERLGILKPAELAQVVVEEVIRDQVADQRDGAATEEIERMEQAIAQARALGLTWKRAYRVMYERAYAQAQAQLAEDAEIMRVIAELL